MPFNIPFNNTYALLPEQFHSQTKPTPVAEPGPIRVNRELSEQLGIDPDWLASAEGSAVIAGNTVPEGAEPIATVYAGHQFGGFNPQLGDGRAVLLGELAPGDGQRFDLQLKGSGRTPYSRGGDGRSPLGPVLREYILCEAMHRLNVPTTRALAAVTTGEMVVREDYLPGAVLARVASSHIRIGTFEFFGARKDTDSLRLLCDHVIARHYPEAAEQDNPILAMLEAVISRQASLIAKWQLLGFIHGVMNTDNMLLCGETVDYGPCAFMDDFNPEQVYSSIDHQGRYAYRNQPGIGHWNLSRLAQALLPLLHEDQEEAVAMAQAAIDAFPEKFLAAHTEGMAAKLGLTNVLNSDTALVEDLFAQMAEHKLDFTLAFRRLADLTGAEGGVEGGAEGGVENGIVRTASESVAELFSFPEAMEPWLDQWRSRLATDPMPPAQRQQHMYAANPAFIPRNHQVEAAIEAATTNQDFSLFHQLVDVLDKPCEYRKEWARYAVGPAADEVVRATFCGT